MTDRTPAETWKPLTEFLGRYEVSSLGRVRSVWTGHRWRDEPVVLVDRPVKNGKGYRFVCLSFNGKAIERNVHRLVATAFLPNPEGKPQVAHLDGNPVNNVVGNLVRATQLENEKHKNTHGYRVRPNAILTLEQVQKIREIFPPRPKWPRFDDVAREMGITRGALVNVVYGKSWKHVGNGRYLLKPIDDNSP